MLVSGSSGKLKYLGITHYMFLSMVLRCIELIGLSVTILLPRESIYW